MPTTLGNGLVIESTPEGRENPFYKAALDLNKIHTPECSIHDKPYPHGICNCGVSKNNGHS